MRSADKINNIKKNVIKTMDTHGQPNPWLSPSHMQLEIQTIC